MVGYKPNCSPVTPFPTSCLAPDRQLPCKRTVNVLGSVYNTGYTVKILKCYSK